MDIENKIIVIKELKELLDRELISVKEYEVHKKRILSYGVLNKAIDELPSYLPKLAWPIFGFILVILFYSPIIDKLSQSSEINVGAFSLKVREGAALIGDPSLALKLEGLSPVAVELLIDSGRKI